MQKARIGSGEGQAVCLPHGTFCYTLFRISDHFLGNNTPMAVRVWVSALLLIISTHVLVLDAVHHSHDQPGSPQASQLAADHASTSTASAADNLDQHCCQCAGATPSSRLQLARSMAPDSGVPLLLPTPPASPVSSLFRPPIA